MIQKLNDHLDSLMDDEDDKSCVSASTDNSPIAKKVCTEQPIDIVTDVTRSLGDLSINQSSM